MAAFTVVFADGVTTSYSGDAAHVSIDARTGVLTVLDGEGTHLRCSPVAWLKVEEKVGPDIFGHHHNPTA